MKIVQINLQRSLGGGEIYTRFLTRTFESLRVECELVVHAHAGFWKDLLSDSSVKITQVSGVEHLVNLYRGRGGIYVGHGPLPSTLVASKSREQIFFAIAHMPVQDRDATPYLGHDRIFAVSNWVRDGLIAANLPVWREALYGVAEFRRLVAPPITKPIEKTSIYTWDNRKVRDRILGLLEPVYTTVSRRIPYTRKPGLTLGIVSRITPIKQFPLLFSRLAPIIRRYSSVNLEFFGSGGYASVRDLKHALRPILPQVRFWGHQSDLAQVYAGLDYLLCGLPEKEALGLNIIEAQYSGVPVIAVNAPPFNETILSNRTGYLYSDPRHDAGASFETLLQELINQSTRIDPRLEHEHLQTFSVDRFRERIQRLLTDITPQFDLPS